MDVRSHLRHPWTCAQRLPSVSTHSRVAVLESLLHHPIVHLSPSVSFDVRLHPLIHSNSLRRATITHAPLFHPPIPHSACSFPPFFFPLLFGLFLPVCTMLTSSIRRYKPAAGRAPFGKTGPPPPPTPPLPPSPPPTCDRDAHQAQHCSTSIATLRNPARLKPKRSTMRTTTCSLSSTSPSPSRDRDAHQSQHRSTSIATLRTPARLKPKRSSTRTTTRGLSSSTTAPSVLSRRLRWSRRPGPQCGGSGQLFRG
ncbi:hypothetical protein C8J57DRAFT_1528552 [Mycena rebaudengoi]|nr:hypothetical protein C8J57DRAFT_1528552 [Mycena rebaudengoi]